MLSPKLEKTYNPSLIEEKWYNHWMEKDYFSTDSSSEKDSYTIVIPPPNVTGILTVGHVLNNTIQDILIRKARMEGKEACWIPGTDHASIATEAKVVKMLQDKGINKKDLDREEFLEYAWKWKDKYGGIIIEQLKRLGCSCDWSRERFTMDEGYSNAVLEAFVKLYHKGFIYKGHRIVNWCPVSKSAISDEEVIFRETKGSLWHFRYPIVDSKEYVVVATTRPETIFGDTAVSVNPSDNRYKHLIGKSVTIPLVGRVVPILGDKFVDPEFGTGCIKVTPAHDPNDFIIGERHGLDFINIMNEDASLNSNVPKDYIGLTRENARKQVVKDFELNGFLHKKEEYVNNVGYSERGNVPIEFYMSDQWFMKMNDLALPAKKAVEDGKIQFHPAHWKKTYDHWMNNIKDWCISRQLLWGHQIPVWYHKKDKKNLHVSVSGPNDPENWIRDPDVLDTWASSWIWPIGVHSWPKDDENIKKFYPTDVLVTGPDIIFFWVARMIMTGFEFRNELPFKDVYFTSILRDEDGKKLSKSLGNSPDPIDLFNEFGTDAVRFGIMLMAPQGLDVLFSKDRLEIGRNFMNKLWNACRFIEMNLDNELDNEDDIDSLELDLPEKWILSRLSRMVLEYNKQLDRFHFNEAAKQLYEFTWNDFCDWYVEIAKTRFYGDNQSLKKTTKLVSLKCIRTILTLLHPFAPFITEELWTHFKHKKLPDIIIAPWIKKQNHFNAPVEKEMKILKEVIISIRSIRSRMNVKPSKLSDLVIRSDDKKILFNDYDYLIKSLARVKNIKIGKEFKKPKHSATAIIGGVELYVPLQGLVDLVEEKNRMDKRIRDIERLLKGINSKLSNQAFLERAPKSVVAKEKKNLHKLNEELDKITTNLEILK